MKTAKQPALERILLRVVRGCRRHPWVVLTASILVAAVALLWTARRLEFRTSRSALVQANTEWNRRFAAYRQELGGSDDILVVLQDAPLETRERFATALAQKLQGAPWIERVFYRVDPAPFRARALLYLEPSQLEDLRRELEKNREALRSLAASPGLVAMLTWVDRQVSDALVSHLIGGLLGSSNEKPNPARAEKPPDLSFLLTVLSGVENQLTPGAGGTFQSPWGEYLGMDEDEHDGFLVSSNDRFLFVLVRPRLDPKNFNKEGPAVLQVRRTVAELEPRFPNVEVGLTGQPVLSSEEARTTTHDASIAGFISLVGVTLIFWFGFHVRRHAIFTVVAMLISLGWAAGALTLWVGHLTILSVSFVSILTGIGVEFGIHLVARYEEEREKGHARDDALDIAVSQTGSGIVYGALTGSLAFFVLGLTDFKGIAELGIIAGSGLLLCMVAMLTVLPALIAIFPAGLPRRARKKRAERRETAARWWTPPARWVLVGGLLLTVVCAAIAPGVRFDGNILNLQAKGLEAVKLEEQLLQGAGRSSVFAVTMVDSLDEARRKQKQFEALPEVARVESLAGVIPPDQPERLEKVKALAPVVEALPKTRGRAPPVELERLDTVIDRLRFKVRPSDQWREGEMPPKAQLEQAQARLRAVNARLQAVSRLPANAPERRQVERQLATYQDRLVADFYDKLSILEASPHTTPITLQDVPSGLREQLLGRTGKFLLRIYPEKNVWEPELAGEFVTALRTVDPAVTGAPVQAWETTRAMERGYVQGGLYALGVTVLLLLLDFRSVWASLLALIPLCAGALWTLGFMVLSGIRFNLANLVIVPLIIGLSIDIGIHLVHRARADGLVGWPLVASSTGRAVGVGALTSALGFGALIVSRHQGMRSIGILLTVGMALPLLAAFAVLCPLLEVLRRRRRRSRGLERGAPESGRA